MSSAKNFIILNAVVVTLLVVYFLIRKREMPTRLNFKNKDKTPARLPESAQGGSISLNVMFNYNGHTFDAYEVLNVPAGSTLDEAKAAYNRSLGNVDPASKAFYQAALEAIKSSARKAR